MLNFGDDSSNGQTVGGAGGGAVVAAHMVEYILQKLCIGTVNQSAVLFLISNSGGVVSRFV